MPCMQLKMAYNPHKNLTKELIIISGMLLILPLELIFILSSGTSCFCFFNELATFQSHPISIENLGYKPQIIVPKNPLLDVFES